MCLHRNNQRIIFDDTRNSSMFEKRSQMTFLTVNRNYTYAVKTPFLSSTRCFISVTFRHLPRCFKCRDSVSNIELFLVLYMKIIHCHHISGLCTRREEFNISIRSCDWCMGFFLSNSVSINSSKKVSFI